jgi:molybdenum cofactor biosynthesis enzyme MoaA
MRLKALTFVLTENCNFRCVYCYKKLRKASLRFSLARRLLVFFCRI